ncbi:hypothetical protein EV177_008345, partial [Coemansia sp. RSA 1804]
MAWLSEDDPTNEYEVIGTRSQDITSPYMRTSELEKGAAAAEAAVRAKTTIEGQQQQPQEKKLPIIRADPTQIEQMAVMLQERFTMAANNSQMGVPMEQYKHVKVAKNAEAKDSKAGMSRLKSIFRIGHGSSSNSIGSSASVGSISLPKPAAASMTNVGKSTERKAAQVRGVHNSLPQVNVQQRIAQHELASNNSNSNNNIETRERQQQQQQQHQLGSQYVPRPPQKPNAVEYGRGRTYSVSPNLPIRGAPGAADSSMGHGGRLQVVVPPGHLSIVYPDSPMSKTDTLGQSSADSLTRKLGAGGAASSGRAYLVDPDAREDDGDEEDNRYTGRAEGVKDSRDYVSPSAFKA